MYKIFNKGIVFVLLLIFPFIAMPYNITLVQDLKENEGIGSKMTLIDSSWVISSVPNQKKIEFDSTQHEVDAEFTLRVEKNAVILYHLKIPVVNVAPIKRARLTEMSFENYLYGTNNSLFTTVDNREGGLLKISDLKNKWKDVIKKEIKFTHGGIFIKNNDQYELVGLIGKNSSPIDLFSSNTLIDNIIIAYALGGEMAAKKVTGEPIIQNITKSFGDHPAIAADFTLIDSSWIISKGPLNKIEIGSKTYEINFKKSIDFLADQLGEFYLSHLKTPVVDVQPVKRARLTNDEFLHLLPKSEIVFVFKPLSPRTPKEILQVTHIPKESSDMMGDEFNKVQLLVNNKARLGTLSCCFIKNNQGEYELLGLMHKPPEHVHLSPIHYQLFTLFPSIYSTRDHNTLIDNAIIAYALGGEKAATDALLTNKERKELENKKKIHRRSRSFGSLSELKLGSDRE